MTGGQGVAGSNPVAPTISQTCSAYDPVQALSSLERSALRSTQAIGRGIDEARQSRGERLRFSNPQTAPVSPLLLRSCGKGNRGNSPQIRPVTSMVPPSVCYCFVFWKGNQVTEVTRVIATGVLVVAGSLLRQRHQPSGFTCQRTEREDTPLDRAHPSTGVRRSQLIRP